MTDKHLLGPRQDAAMNAPYLCQLARSANAVDQAAWQEVCEPDGNPYCDLRFLRAVETSFAAEASFWYAIFRDDSGRPVACTCFSRYLVDVALMAPAPFQRFVAAVRRLWPSFFKHNIMLCGIPVSTCGNQLAVADGIDMDRLIPALDDTALKLARESNCRLISFKEFAPDMATRLAGLKNFEFLPARSVVTYNLIGEFGSFENYLADRSRHNRANIRRHFRKFERAGLTCEHLRGRDGVDRLLTDEVHQLYLNVLARAKIKFERIPAEFFREVARQLPDESCFTIIRKNERIVGFCCGLASRGAHSLLFLGLDYTVNAESDLYFNMVFRALSQGIVPGVEVVHVGATADEFKQRLGCAGEPLSIYVKGVGAVWQFLLRQVFGLLFDTTEAPVVPELAIAKEKSTDGQPDRIAA